MQPPSDPPPAAGRWVSTTEARRRLGLSEGTLRRAIAAGQVKAELRPRNPDSPTDHRMVYEVWLPDAPGEPPAAAMTPEADHPQTATTSDPALITAALAPLLEIVADQSEAIGEERRMVAELHERIAALREQLGRTETERDTLRAELTRAQRPWWRRLLS